MHYYHTHSRRHPPALSMQSVHSPVIQIMDALEPTPPTHPLKKSKHPSPPTPHPQPDTPALSMRSAYSPMIQIMEALASGSSSDSRFSHSVEMMDS